MPSNQSDKNKRGRPAADEKQILALVEAGRSDTEIATELKLSRRTILRIRMRNQNRKPRGGPRPGAGRKDAESVTISELLRQQAIDCATNSWEVGIGRKKISDEDWFRWAGTAFQLSAARTYVRKEGNKDLPARLPRQLPWPGAENMDARAWDAARGGTK